LRQTVYNKVSFNKISFQQFKTCYNRVYESKWMKLEMRVSFMLDKWKNRIKKLFQQNDDIEEMKEFEHVLRNDYDRQQNQQDLKARVTYQYPKQKSFRFPVIPDQMIEEERTTKKAEDRIVQKRDRKSVV